MVVRAFDRLPSANNLLSSVNQYFVLKLLLEDTKCIQYSTNRAGVKITNSGQIQPRIGNIVVRWAASVRQALTVKNRQRAYMGNTHPKQDMFDFLLKSGSKGCGNKDGDIDGPLVEMHLIVVQYTLNFLLQGI